MKILAESLSRHRLSVAMIVRNEQDVLADSIESVGSLADEVVVLDTGSTDQTVAVARQLGAIVDECRWENDFAAARNRCLARATGDWVLWLDAGERFEAASALRQFIEQQADPRTVYTLWVETPPREPTASAEQAVQPRLMPASADLRFAGRVRETLAPAIQASGMATALAPGRIFRHPRLHDLDRGLRKAGRDLSLSALEAGERGDWSARLLLAAGQAQTTLGARDEARRMLRAAVRAAGRGSVEMLDAYYALLATFDGDPEFHTDHLAACLESLAVFPLDAQLLLALGSFLLVRQRLELAVRTFDAAVHLGKITPAAWHLCEVREVAAVCLSAAWEARQDNEEACRTLEAVLAARPDSPRIRQHLLALYMKLGKTQEAAMLAEARPSTLARDAVRPAGLGSEPSFRIDAAENVTARGPHLAAARRGAAAKGRPRKTPGKKADPVDKKGQSD
jgi:glycosyltransferase involved in cell wall biosynthesis